jgi:uncharacterized surface protein with fasciclin (FAS1) repeats
MAAERFIVMNTKIQRTSFVFAGLIGAVTMTVSAPTVLAQCSGSTASAAQSEGNIVTTAVGAGQFNTLVAAVKAAGLADALSGPGPFTVFAPTDEAFKKLPAGTVESLLKPENKDKLVSILKYHVVPGNLLAADVTKIPAAVTLGGQRIDIRVGTDGVTVDNAKVVKTDITTGNGVIHVIDSVIMPSGDSIVATADKAGTFKTLLTACKAAGLDSTLSSDGPFTVFAPTDEAFSKLPAGTIEMLLKPENKDTLAAVLKYHVVSGRVFSNDAIKAGKAATVQGDEITITTAGSSVKINDATVVAADLDATNGVIHVIDAVILPKAVADKLAGKK